jgi:hypothetical protein
VDWSDNIAISDLAPSHYWPQQLDAKGLTSERLTRAMYWHALPEGWEHMDYERFLAERRKRMAIVVCDAMTRLADPDYTPQYATPHVASGVAESSTTTELRRLVDTDLLPPGTTISAGEGTNQYTAHVLPDGRLYAEGNTYDTIIELSEAVGVEGNPWAIWSADLPDGRATLNVLREAQDDEELATRLSGTQHL